MIFKKSPQNQHPKIPFCKYLIKSSSRQVYSFGLFNSQQKNQKMLRKIILNRSPFFRFCTETNTLKSMLKKNLYSIQLINKSLNRRVLSMFYSPGVGAVCEAIQNDKNIADTMTLRGRSVAILTDGSFFKSEGKKVMPVMDWIVAQVKYYSGKDPFPFVISKDSNVEQLIKDLSTSYSTVLYLDDKEIKNIPENIILIRQKDIIDATGCSVVDFESAANVIGHLVDSNFRGRVTRKQIQAGKDYAAETFGVFRPYPHMTKDSRDIYKHALQIHEFYKGKIHIEINFRNINGLKKIFTEANLRKVVDSDEQVYSKTSKLMAIVSDGTAVLGYGNMGPMQALPVMQGKSLLFKLLGDVDVVPICIYPRETVEEEVTTIKNLLGNFAAINLEDIKAPQCFDVEKGLEDLNLLPIFHDDQHGTAIVTLAGLINACKLTSRKIQDTKCVINGAGAAGLTIAKLLLSYGFKDIVVCDSTGTIYKGREENMNNFKHLIAQITNMEGKRGKLVDVIKGTDVFIGVSSAGALHAHWVSSMNKDSIVLAMANPIPQIMPDQAKAAGAFIYGSGRSDFENQINNSLVFPGIFRGIAQHQLKSITQAMKIKAAQAIAKSIEGLPRKNYIIPDSLDKDVAIRISNEIGKVVSHKKQDL